MKKIDTFNYYYINYNPGQNIWNKTDLSSKTGQENKSLVSAFACFFNCY